MNSLIYLAAKLNAYAVEGRSPLSPVFQEKLSTEILGWCPAGPVLPHLEKVPL